MASYTLKLTPTLRNLGTEGSLDTSVVNGVSLQRTGYMTTADGGDAQLVKVTELNDGQTFTDTVQTIADLGFTS